VPTIVLDPTLEPSAVQLDDIRQNIPLDGNKDGTNRVFTVPSSEKFYHTTNMSISVHLNGQQLVFGTNYTVEESGGAGTGYDQITFLTDPPQSTDDTLTGDFVRKVLS